MDGELLSETFVELTDTMVADFDVIDFLHVLTDRSVQLLDVSAAGLLLADPRGELRVVAASSEAARLLELFQIQNDQGPCLDCFRRGEPVDAEDLADAARRWPRFAPAAAAGFAAVQALPMRLREQVVGALNLLPRRLREPSRPRTYASARPWPTWPPSACCTSAACVTATPSTSSCRPR